MKSFIIRFYYIKFKIYQYLFKLDLLSEKKITDVFYYYKLNKKINWENPQTLNEKLQWLKLNNKNKYHSKLTDKLIAKREISKKIGREYIIPTLGVYENPDEIVFDNLPEKFIIKCSHSSGANYFIKGKFFNKSSLIKKINKKLNSNYYYYTAEWNYKNIHPRLFIEPIIAEKTDDEPLDYKFYCFNGKPMFFAIVYKSIFFYDLNWKRLNIERYDYPIIQNKIFAKPENFDKMIKIAEILSKEIPFVRVDLYNAKGRIYFGEMTFTPGAAAIKWKDERTDYELGKLLDLSFLKN